MRGGDGSSTSLIMRGLDPRIFASCDYDYGGIEKCGASVAHHVWLKHGGNKKGNAIRFSSCAGSTRASS